MSKKSADPWDLVFEGVMYCFMIPLAIVMTPIFLFFGAIGWVGRKLQLDRWLND